MDSHKTVNWTWDLRSRDGGMNGLDFARCITAGGFARVLIHAAPARLAVSVTTTDGSMVVRGDCDREGEYSPMTLLSLEEGRLRRSEVWPDERHHGLPVLLCGGEVGMLKAWRHAGDLSWWQWSVEFSNHVGRPSNWAPPDEVPTA